ncbi:MAG: 23S rRNA (guanosine(2251)-2'-O)-methyltransferase RlmB [Oscillospiraceae bacterium]|jgi:23S rRNA (guanosine2251-2'-O)-methyltransferase|nr:23S rRNA (guanosine(2251)-2'-O)-methyltransferase RlmB [Oscillospiraceae bacterium]
MGTNDSKSIKRDQPEEENGVLYGRNVVTEFLRSGRHADTLFVSSDTAEKDVSFYKALAAGSGAVIKTVPSQKLTRICGSDRHQGVAVSASFCDYVTLNDILKAPGTDGKAPFIIICDGIEDPHNLGAILRTAECAGVSGVIIPKRRGAGVNATVHRTSAGACSHIPICRVSNIVNTIRELKKAGVFCYCADMGGSYCYDTDLTGPVAMVIGSEGFGVSRLVRESCDGVVSLPMFGQINSLNASAAASAIIYEIVRQRIS